MVRFVKISIGLLALSIFASCSTELKVETKAVEADCVQFPDAAACVKSLPEGLNLNFIEEAKEEARRSERSSSKRKLSVHRIWLQKRSKYRAKQHNCP